MSTKWRYYNSKRGGSGFRGRGRGRGRGTSLTAVSLPREDHLHSGKYNEYYKDRPMKLEEFRDETVLSISFGQNMLGAAYYEQSSQVVKIMNDISEDHEFAYLDRLIDDVKPTMILVNKSQDLSFIKFLTSRYESPAAKEEADKTDEAKECISKWDSSLAYSDTTTIQEEKDDEDEASDEPTARLYKLPNNFFKMSKALERLKRMVGSDDPSMTDENKYTIVAMRFDVEAVNMMRSLGALLLYLDETRMGVESEPLTVTSPIKSIKTLTLQHLVEIDYNTIQALDILPKETDRKKSSGQQKSLFSLMDMCRSTVGKKCLRKWFRNPTSDREELISRQKCVHFFKQDWNAEITAKISSMLGKVKPLNSIFCRFQSGTAQLIHWEGFVSTVNALVEVIDIIRQTSIASELSVEGELLREVCEVAVITGSIINFADSKLQGRVTIMPGIDAELDKTRDTYENMPMILTAIARQEGDRLGLGQFSNVTCLYVPLVGFILSLPRDFPVGSHSDMALVYATNDEVRVKNSTTERLEEEFGDVLMKLIDSQTAIILSLKTKVMKRKRSINTLLALVAKVDALVSLGIVAAENGWNCPGLVDEPVIEAVELFHPISALVVKKQFVPNQVSSGRKGVKVSIITGPNACGKSVYMKSIGMFAFLAHIGSFVPARHAKIGPVDRIITRMFTVDSVLDGMSTFAKDVEQVALALRKATTNSLVIIDEFGKGTMTEVGLSLLASCMNHWMRKGAERCPHIFLSSHFHALPRYIPLETEMATFLTFTVLRESGGKIKYLFQLTPGMVDCSFAMAVAKEEGIPMQVIGRACRIYKALKSGTRLKEIRADIENKDEDSMIADMNLILETGEGFIDAVEVFVKRDQMRNDDESEKESVRSNSAFPNEPTPEKQAHKGKNTASSSNKKEKPQSRPRSSATPFSPKSLASMDQLSMFNALLPVSKVKKPVEVQKERESSTRVLSPDLFTIEDEEGEDEDKEEYHDKPAQLVPMMQRLSSEEEREKNCSRTSESVSRNAKDIADKPLQDERAGIKRPRSSSTNDDSSDLKKKENNLCFNDPRSIHMKSQIDDTQIFVEPRNLTVPKSVRAQFDDSLFKTPTSIRRVPKSSSSHHQLSQISKTRTPCKKTENSQSKESELDSIFKMSQSSNRSAIESLSNSKESSSKKLHPNTSRRSSSRREIRTEDSQLMSAVDSPEAEWRAFSPIGSQFSIFHSQQSTSGFDKKDSSGRSNMESNDSEQQFFNTDDADTCKSSQRSVSKEADKFSFQTPKSKSFIHHKSSLTERSQSSRQSVSPSSVILGELTRENEERTPLPRGDKVDVIDFEFNPTDDDPVYGRKGPTNNLMFDFLKSDDEDEEFLKSFVESEKSLRIDTSVDRTAGSSIGK